MRLFTKHQVAFRATNNSRYDSKCLFALLGAHVTHKETGKFVYFFHILRMFGLVLINLKIDKISLSFTIKYTIIQER